LSSHDGVFTHELLSETSRLLFNLISATPGYEKPEWLTQTNAPDDGRDLSVYRVQTDKLAGVIRSRVIIACKHWLSKSVDLSEVTILKAQMALWEPPRVDCLVIAVSGRFTTQAVHWIEKHNQSDSALKIEMWPCTHFEWLLAQRPGLIAEFRLR
jgi:Restriction endonuclease